MDAVGMQAGSYRYFEKNLKIQEPGSGMYSLPTGTLGTFQNKGLSESDFCLRQISLVWVRGILGSGVGGRHEIVEKENKQPGDFWVERGTGKGNREEGEGVQMSLRWNNTRN